MSLVSSHLTRATLAAALLSATVLVQPAAAGLLGGGAVGGGLGGGLGGSLGPRSLDVRGAAAGQASHDLAVRRTGQQAAHSGAATTGAATGTATSQGNTATSQVNTATGQVNTAAAAGRSQAESSTARGASVDAQKSLSLDQRTNGVDAGGAAAAQAARGDRSVGASGAARTSVQR